MEKLIEEYFKENELDVDKLVDDFSGYIYTIINNSINQFSSREDFEEIISDVFFIVWKNQNKLNREKTFRPYIAGITKNLIKEKLRKSNKVLDINDYFDKLESQESIEYIYDSKEEMQFLEDSLSECNNIDIEIFRAFYYKDMSIKQISKRMKLSEFSVKSRLYRIRKKLRKDLKEGGYGNGK